MSCPLPHTHAHTHIYNQLLSLRIPIPPEVVDRVLRIRDCVSGLRDGIEGSVVVHGALPSIYEDVGGNGSMDPERGSDSSKERIEPFDSRSDLPKSPSVVVEVDNMASRGTESEYPPLLSNYTTNPWQGVDRDAELFEKNALRWVKEEEDRAKDLTPDNHTFLSSPKHTELHEATPQYIHFFLPGTFTSNHYPYSSSLTLRTPASIFHFPHGATRDQLLAVLGQRQAAGHSRSKLEPPEMVKIIRVRTQGMEWELRNMIAGALKNRPDSGGAVAELDRLWETDGKGDTYIVSAPHIHCHGVSDRSELHENDEETVEEEAGDDEDSWHVRLYLRGGAGSEADEDTLDDEDGSLSDVRYYHIHSNTPTTLEGMRTEYLATYYPLPVHSKNLSWMQEGRILQRKVDSLERDLDILWGVCEKAQEVIEEQDKILADENGKTSQTWSETTSVHEEPSTHDAAATAFYFFPTVSTVVLLTDPLSYLQWPQHTTLAQIRQMLSYNKLHRIEHDANCIRIREILGIRDEMGVRDPDMSDGRVVLIALPETPDGCHADRPAVDTEEDTRVYQGRGDVCGSESSEKCRANLVNTMDADQKRGMHRSHQSPANSVEHDAPPGHDSYPAQTVYMRGGGHLRSSSPFPLYYPGSYPTSPISSTSDPSKTDHEHDEDMLIPELDKPRNFDHEQPPGDTPSPLSPLCEYNHAFWYEQPSEDIRATPSSAVYVPDSEVKRVRGSKEGQATLEAPEPATLLSDELDLNEWRHGRDEGCETWAQRLDAFRTRCTFCDVPFREEKDEVRSLGSTIRSIGTNGVSPESVKLEVVNDGRDINLRRVNEDEVGIEWEARRQCQRRNRNRSMTPLTRNPRSSPKNSDPSLGEGDVDKTKDPRLSGCAELYHERTPFDHDAYHAISPKAEAKESVHQQTQPIVDDVKYPNNPPSTQPPKKQETETPHPPIQPKTWKGLPIHLHPDNPHTCTSPPAHSSDPQTSVPDSLSETRDRIAKRKALLLAQANEAVEKKRKGKGKEQWVPPTMPGPSRTATRAQREENDDGDGDVDEYDGMICGPYSWNRTRHDEGRKNRKGVWLR